MDVLFFWFLWGMLVLIIMFFALPSTLRFINNRAESLREFIEKNDGFFSVFFIVLFAAEQTVLIILLFILENKPAVMKLIVSIFALFVVTTAALQKFLLETKRKYERAQFDAASKAKEVLIRLSERLSQRIKKKR